MTIRARATQVGNHWAIEAEHEGHQVYAQSRRLDNVEPMVRGAFEADGVDIEQEEVDVVRMKKAPDPLMDALALEGQSATDPTRETA